MPRILVVDDEAVQRLLLRRIFERAGHDVTEAIDGTAALTDITMPVMDGLELIRRLRDDPATAHIPILAVSGDTHGAGAADAVVPAPYDRHQLLAVVDALLEKGRGKRQ